MVVLLVAAPRCGKTLHAAAASAGDTVSGRATSTDGASGRPSRTHRHPSGSRRITVEAPSGTAAPAGTTSRVPLRPHASGLRRLCGGLGRAVPNEAGTAVGIGACAGLAVAPGNAASQPVDQGHVAKGRGRRPRVVLHGRLGMWRGQKICPPDVHARHVRSAYAPRIVSGRSRGIGQSDLEIGGAVHEEDLRQGVGRCASGETLPAWAGLQDGEPADDVDGDRHVVHGRVARRQAARARDEFVASRRRRLAPPQPSPVTPTGHGRCPLSQHRSPDRPGAAASGGRVARHRGSRARVGTARAHASAAPSGRGRAGPRSARGSSGTGCGEQPPCAPASGGAGADSAAARRIPTMTRTPLRTRNVTLPDNSAKPTIPRLPAAGSRAARRHCGSSSAAAGGAAMRTSSAVTGSGQRRGWGGDGHEGRLGRGCDTSGVCPQVRGAEYPRSTTAGWYCGRHPGRLAQWESASFTPRRPLVQSQHRPHRLHPERYPSARCRSACALVRDALLWD